MKKKLMLGGVLLGLSANAFSYDVIERYKILEDKFKTEEMMRPLGHDFLLDINAWANKNLLDLVDDVKTVSDKTGDATTNTEKLTAAQELMVKYKDTEQTLKAKINFGIPLFSFTAFGVKIVPDLRASVDLGANVGIKTEPITVETFETLIPQDAPPELIDAADSITSLPAAGTDLIQYALNQWQTLHPGEPVPAELQQAVTNYEGDFVMPTIQDLPNLFAYTKLDAKGGFLINYERNRIFGNLNLYGLHRTDFKTRVTAEMIANGNDFMDGAKKENTQIFAMLDYKLGYKYKIFSATASVEEIKLKRLSDKIETGGNLNYEPDPLYRMHLDGLFKLSIFSLRPFVGAHLRSGYGISEGYYAGSDLGAYVWGDRLGLQLRAMVDSEHLTITPRMKLWLMQLEYSLKQPIKSEIDGTKVSTLHSVNLRFFL